MATKTLQIDITYNIYFPRTCLEPKHVSLRQYRINLQQTARALSAHRKTESSTKKSISEATTRQAADTRSPMDRLPSTAQIPQSRHYFNRAARDMGLNLFADPVQQCFYVKKTTSFHKRKKTLSLKPRDTLFFPLGTEAK